MIIRPQSLDTFKTFNQLTPNTYHNPFNSFHQPTNSNQMRKRIQNFSFLPSDKIGRGYSSTVYKGVNQLTKQPVAIKIIQLKSLKDQNTKRFLQNQLQCLRNICHLNVLRYFFLFMVFYRYVNSFMTANNCYIITELYDEGDLAKLLKEREKFAEVQAFGVFNQFYQGYVHLNTRGYIHRDIKPSNVLIKTNMITNQNIYVIADFGFIKHLTQNPHDSFNVGTPVYMAPQSITANIYTVKSDIWSMGIMLFEIVYGFLPFQCKSENQLKREICNREIRLQDIQETKGIYTSNQFKSFLLNCLRKNPENRISLEDMAQHPWMRKFKATYDVNIGLRKTPIEDYIRLNMSFSRQKQSPVQEDRKYGYIGNLAIRRQKSVQANDFSLKNNFSHKSIEKSFNRDTSLKDNFRKQSNLTLERHIQKARQLGLSNPKQPKPQAYWTQGLKAKLPDSPNIDFLLQRKTLQPKSSMLDGMKGIVNLKNNQIGNLKNNQVLRIGFEGKVERKMVGYISGGKSREVMEMSTSLEEEDTMRSFNINNNSSAMIGKQSIGKNNISPQTQPLSPLTQPFITQSPSYHKTQSLSTLPSNSTTFTNKQHTPTQPFPTSSPLLSSPTTPTTPSQFYMKLLHLLRYVHQVLSLLMDLKNDLLLIRYKEGRQALEQFFVGYFKKVEDSILGKENVFQLEGWAKFVQSDKFKGFVDVVDKYVAKYKVSNVVGQYLNNAYQNTISQKVNITQKSTNKYQSISYYLLKQAQAMSAQSKQKKSIKSTQFNKQIILIHNMHKCLIMIQTIVKMKDMSNITPDKQLEEMTTKSKDPFKIPKILIQLKKKLMQQEAMKENYGSIHNYNEESGNRRGRISLNR